MKSTYMLYDNGGGESLAFGDIEYIADIVFNDYSRISTAKPNLKSVLKIINAQDDLMLMKVVSKHCS
jgi:hypothetical protein